MAALGERGRGAAERARRVETMVTRYGPALLRVANQFSLCHDDALDAYQRGLEIYLRRMDSVDPATEGAWMRVVVKHEAMAIRKARQASVDHEDTDLDASVHPALREVDETVAGGERVGRSAEALRALKPDEAKALLLKAEGLSYDEIGKRFGWTYTKVNRSIAEGRKRFLNVFSEIESGEACAGYADALDALAEGRATSAQTISLRPHLRHCSACRATVRQMRFSRTRRFLLFGPFAWVTRVLARPEVFAASSGGGRLGPAAAAVGLCLSGVGAATCVMTGAIPAAPIIATIDRSEPTPPPAPRKAAAKPASKRPAARRTKVVVEQPARTYAATATPTPRPAKRTPKLKARAATQPTAASVERKPVVAAEPPVKEFSFETKAPPPPRRAPVANAAATRGASNTPSARTRSGGTASGGGEFGFEGG